MKKTLLILAALLAVPVTAHADAKSNLADEMIYYLGLVENETWAKSDVEATQSEQECAAAIKKSKLADSDEIEVYGGDTVAPSTKKGTQNGRRLITVAVAKKVCVKFGAVKAYQGMRLEVEKAYSTAEWMTLVKPEETGMQEGLTDRVRKCLTALDGMVALGMSGSDTIRIDQGTPTVDEARVVCTKAVADAAKFEGAVTSREGAEKAELEAIYKKVGVKGKKLELFVYYGKPEDGNFLAAGCRKFVTTAKGLAKAKKLFIWLTANDGTITVRKYTFKKNAYKTTEKTFLTEARAYKGCK